MTKDKKKEGQRQGTVKPQTPSEQLTNYKYRGVRGPCPTSASLVQGSCIRNMSPQNTWLWKSAEFTFRTPRGLKETGTPLLMGAHKILDALGLRAKVVSWKEPGWHFIWWFWRAFQRGRRQLELILGTQTLGAVTLGNWFCHEDQQAPLWNSSLASQCQNAPPPTYLSAPVLGHLRPSN